MNQILNTEQYFLTQPTLKVYHWAHTEDRKPNQTINQGKLCDVVNPLFGLDTARQGFSGWGSSTAAIAATGETSPARVTLTETWNGTNWTEVGDLNTARSGTGSSRVDSTSGIVFGGFESAPTDSNVNKVELWNGTNWTETTDLSGTAYQQQSGAGTGSSAISFGGEGPSNEMRTGTEEWTGPGVSITRTFTDS